MLCYKLNNLPVQIHSVLQFSFQTTLPHTHAAINDYDVSFLHFLLSPFCPSPDLSSPHRTGTLTTILVSISLKWCIPSTMTRVTLEDGPKRQDRNTALPHTWSTTGTWTRTAQRPAGHIQEVKMKLKG